MIVFFKFKSLVQSKLFTKVGSNQSHRLPILVDGEYDEDDFQYEVVIKLFSYKFFKYKLFNDQRSLNIIE